MRLDTYSGAPVDFAAYKVDPADVLVAGAGARPRALDTRTRKPVATWRFTPPQRLTYEINDVEVPLQNREGFYVVEARRGDATQQVWIDVSRVGLVTKESPGGVVVYGCDLGSGKALAGMRVTALVGSAFVYAKTDAHGLVRLGGERRPRFALAEWGGSVSFVSFLAASPVPPAVVGVRVDRAGVHAGERLRVVGFARKRAGTAYRPASGDVRIALVAKGRQLGTVSAHLDGAGAFAADLPVGASAPAGDAAVIATAAGASAGATVRIDSSGDVALAVGAPCSAACSPDGTIPLTVVATRAGVPAAGLPIRVTVTRSPHVLAPGATETERWATTTVEDVELRTDAAGRAALTIPAPTDGLPSTYGVVASAGGSTATARLVAPQGRVALEARPDRTTIDVGERAAIDVRGFDVGDGAPAPGVAVHVRIAHGPTVQEQTVTLDRDGRATAVFRDVAPGTEIVTADATVDDKRIVDADAIMVTPGAFGAGGQRSVEVTLSTDAARYRPGARVAVNAALPGAAGDALVTLDGARELGAAVVRVADGRASAALTLPETVGDAAVGVVFVRDGAIHFATQRIAVDGPGHARLMQLIADGGSFAPGATVRLNIADGGESGAATIAIRVADGVPVDGARFEDVTASLDAAATTTQATATQDPAWHGSVTPQRSTASGVFTSDRANATVAGAAMARAGGAPLSWRIDRADRGAVSVTLPDKPGRYVVSVMKIGDDGDVGAATLAVTVR